MDNDDLDEEFIPTDLEYVCFEDGDPARHVFFSPSMKKKYYSYEF